MKVTTLISLCILSLHASGQEYVATPHGLRDRNDTANSYFMIPAPNKTAKELYDRALRFISENFSDPKKAITEDIDSTSLKFDTYVPYLLTYNNSGAHLGIEAYYTISLQFFDGRFRYEIINLLMKGQDSKYKLLFQGGFLEAYIVYNKKGKLFKPQTKYDIENYFNSEVKRMTDYLNGTAN
ncbi:MAG: DUF4468 domain-containing protein [Bacteroidetes bacterium]|nr:DUF4468 domain-containing protein [Bacteroidota bacterium]